MSFFRFKQFEIKQDKTAMKVGTDGVLLGAWADLNGANSILDIGSGTGLITLMCAQRSSADIFAVEIDKDAYEQCLENISASKWQSRIKVYNGAIQNVDLDQKFDVVISNPPFFQQSLKTKDPKKNLARHTDSLSFNDLLKHCSNLLNKNGRANFIIPFDSESEFLKISESFNLYPNKLCRVKGNENSEIKRSLIQLSFSKSSATEVDNLSIELSRHVYTDEYINLTKDFYLKM